MNRFYNPCALLNLLLAAVIIVLSALLYSARTGARVDGSVIHYVPSREKVAALTFDDGPHPVFTPEILHILEKYKVRATFFMIGNRMEKYPDVVKQVLDDGNVIANHTYTHPHNIEADSDAQIIRELDQCEQVIEKMTGKRAHLFRPPRGLVNGNVLTIADEEGYKTILWTVCADHHDAKTPEQMAKRVMDRIRPGAIILVHDGSASMRWRDVPATEEIIRQLQAEGYRFVTVPELLKLRNRRGV